MDVHQLELFLAVMESSSVTRAAERIHLSPGAVSLQLHSLASQLHTELFVRSRKRLVPTPAAIRLADRARDVLRLMNQIQQEFDNDLLKDSLAAENSATWELRWYPRWRRRPEFPGSWRFRFGE
jgi:DNA-binding transcriptional LysR family regulator